MKKLALKYSFAALLLLAVVGCTDKEGIDNDVSFLSTATSANLGKIFDISNDNSGKVKITPIGEGISSSVVSFGHGSGASASATVLTGGSTIHAYPEGNYTVTIVSTDIAGKTVTNTYPLTVTYRAPENIAVTINQSVHNMKVSAKADYAASYQVFFGDVANETGTALAAGAEVSHDYAKAGNYNVKVVALSGGAAKSEKTIAVTVTDPFGLPIDFESAFISYFFGTFGGGQGFATVANPNPTGLNTSAKVGKFIRGYEGWSGTYSPLNTPIDFTQGKKIKVLVYNPDPALVGKSLNVELEAATGGNPANGVAVLKVPVTKSGAWEELVFDFAPIAGIPANAQFNQLVLRFNDSSDGAGAVIYVDNFRLTN
ncbi:MAG: PKD domain-containing protein [Marinilabiliales bacterium]|nr:PKD domain-containing protein [Marinilabiliales bacterium]